MAKSSIFERFIIDTPEGAKNFVDTIEKSEKAIQGEDLSPSYPFLTDPEKIRQLVAKRDKKK